jgi:hypothetical protein
LRHLSNTAFLNDFDTATASLCDKPAALLKYNPAILFLNSTILRLSYLGISLAETIRTLMSRDMKEGYEDSPKSDEKIILGILHYCVEYPDAKDTPDGILKWWRSKDQSEWRREDVQKALDFLTSKGWLTKRKTIPSKEIYGINKDRLQEIESFLLQSAGENAKRC